MTFELLQAVRISPGMIPQCGLTRRERDNIMRLRGLVTAIEGDRVEVLMSDFHYGEFDKYALIASSLSE